MNIDDLKLGEEYVLIHAYGGVSHTIKIIQLPDASNIFIKAKYISTGICGGNTIRLNRIECKRYVKEI